MVNVQGDLPTISPGTIRAALAPLADPAVDIATLAAEIVREEERDDPNVVKVVGSEVAPGRLRALYFTRATAPAGPGPLYHHIGLYAYRRAALARFVALPPSPLERRERLEQLRALEAGMRIDVAIVETVPLGVDVAADLTAPRPARGAPLARASAWPGSPSLRSRSRPVSSLRTTPMTRPVMSKKTIVFQGEPGANSHIACQEAFPEFKALPARPSRTPSRR